jgi:two-component sensor histidine kinase
MRTEGANGQEQLHMPGSVTTGDAGGINPAELLLLREMTHRINNELTSMIGFVSLVAARSTNDSAKLALAEVLMHLHEYARLHRVLQIPTENRLIDATSYLRGLCQAISRAKPESSRIELVFVEHPILLHSLQCWRLGMILSELITNSYRHAFGESGGTISVELRRRGSRAECRVADDGRSSGNARFGHGLSIVRQLVDALDGQIDLTLGKDGTVGLISFPIFKQVRDHSAIK